MTINELVKKAHENAACHGFWDDPLDFGTAIALIHSELSEALEEHRNGNPMIYYPHNRCGECGGRCIPDAANDCPDSPETCGAYQKGKPEGIAVELADAVIRIADLCGYMGIDLESVISEKMKYNESRPYRHGKNY